MPLLETMFVNGSQVLAVMECPTCGVVYGLSETVRTKNKESGGSWYCPNGHTLSYTKTATAELREKLDAEKDNARWWRERADQKEQEAAHAERRRRSTKAVLTKTKKRVAEGACPCCSKRFPDVKAHMAEAHPSYAYAER